MQPSKYTRTYHLPWSKGVQSDDKIIQSLDHFQGMEIVVHEKLDGENTNLYSAEDGGIYHARSISSQFNWTRSWVAKMHSVLQHDIPKGMKLIGENLFAEHSIRYENLNGYFYLFAIWKETPKGTLSLSINEVNEYAELFDLPTPKEIYRGIYDESILIDITNTLDSETIEGYVVRNANSFYVNDTQKNIAKYVRENHIQSDAEHWLKNAVQNGQLVQKIKPFYMK